jgi:hypothetical protein
VLQQRSNRRLINVVIRNELVQIGELGRSRFGIYRGLIRPRRLSRSNVFRFTAVVLAGLGAIRTRVRNIGRNLDRRVSVGRLGSRDPACRVFLSIGGGR